MTANIQIIGSYTSPFSRIARLIAEEMGVTYKMEESAFYMRNTPERESFLKQNNPLMKTPVLIHGKNTVIDSAIIASYLMKNFTASNDFRTKYPKNLTEENITSVIYGVMDGGISRFITQTAHPEINMDSGYMKRSLERMHSGLEWLNNQPTLGEDFGFPEALLICGLDWFEKRNLIDFTNYTNLQIIRVKFSDRPSVITTRSPEDA